MTAFYDFFRYIKLYSTDGTTLEHTIEADAVTDSLSISRGAGVAWTGASAATDSFKIDVNYQLEVPVSTTSLRLTDVNSVDQDIALVAGTNMNIVRDNANQLTISSLVGGISKAISSITQANPAVIQTTNPHNFTEGTPVTITDVNGMTQLNGNEYYMNIITGNTFSLYANPELTTTVDSTGFGAYTSGGVATGEYGGATKINELSDAIANITDFPNSILIGHNTTGVLSGAARNTFIGLPGNSTSLGTFAAGQTITSGDDNTGIGAGALSKITTGSWNTAVGSAALGGPYSQTDFITHSYSTAVGGYAGWRSKSGNYNTLIGYSAGKEMETGGSNTAVGAISMQAMESGSHNTAVGYFALDNPEQGEDNVVIGARALLGGTATSPGPLRNIVIGRDAGFIITTATDNVLIGYTAGDAIATGSNNVIIGDYAGTATLADTVAIYAGSTERLTIDSTGGTLNGNPIVTSNSISGTVTGHILPDTNIAYDLGSATHKFRDLYLDGSSLHLGSTILRDDGLGNLQANLTNILEIAADDSTIRTVNSGESIKFIGAGTVTTSTDTEGNLTITSNETLTAKQDGADFTDSIKIGDTTTGTLNNAHSNIFIGKDTGKTVTSGNKNTVIGHQAGDSITNGTNNVLIGAGAGDSITGGDGNIIIGDYSASSNTNNSTRLVTGDGTTRLYVGQYGTTLDGTALDGQYSQNNWHHSTQTGAFRVQGESGASVVTNPPYATTYLERAYITLDATNDPVAHQPARIHVGGGHLALHGGDGLKKVSNTIIEKDSTWGAHGSRTAGTYTGVTYAAGHGWPFNGTAPTFTVIVAVGGAITSVTPEGYGSGIYFFTSTDYFEIEDGSLGNGGAPTIKCAIDSAYTTQAKLTMVGDTSLAVTPSGATLNGNSVLTSSNLGGTMTAHILPDSDAAYDLGSAEYKIRHLFLSSNSLWIGDDHKVNVEGGKQKYKKRKKGIVPAGVQTLLIPSVFADVAALKVNFKALIHDPAPSNILNPDHGDFNPPTNKWQDFLALYGHNNIPVEIIYDNTSDFDSEGPDQGTTEGDIVYFDGTDYKRLPIGTAAQVLLANGSGTAPEWGDNAGGGSLTIADEGSALATSATTLDFVGAGVTVSGTGATKTVTIPGGGGGGGGAWTLLDTTNVSAGSSSVDFTSSIITNTYTQYVIQITDLKPTTGQADLYCRMGNSSSFDSGGTDYYTRYHPNYASAAGIGLFDNSDKILMTNSADANGSINATIYLYSPSTATSETSINFQTAYTLNSNEVRHTFGAGARLETAAHDMIQFYPSASTWASGTIKVYGVGSGGGGSALTVSDEGSNLTTSATELDFVGAGVTASGTGATKTVTIPGGSAGAWNLIGTQVASNSASLTVTGLDSTYASYAIVFTDMVASVDAVATYFRVGTSGGIDSGASDYAYHSPNTNIGSSGNNYDGSVSTSAEAISLHNEMGINTGDNFGGTIYLQRSTTGVPLVNGTTVACKNITTGSPEMKGGFIYGSRKAVINLDRVNFSFSSGLVVSGRMSVYGISHA